MSKIPVCRDGRWNSKTEDNITPGAVSGIVFAVLLVLLAIESHQDKVLNEITIEENKKNGGNIIFRIIDYHESTEEE